MKEFKTLILMFISILIIQGCDKSDSEEEYLPPSFSSLPKALLGEEIEIDGQGFKLGKLQVFFDNEESAINYVTDKK